MNFIEKNKLDTNGKRHIPPEKYPRERVNLISTGIIFIILGLIFSVYWGKLCLIVSIFGAGFIWLSKDYTPQKAEEEQKRLSQISHSMDSATVEDSSVIQKTADVMPSPKYDYIILSKKDDAPLVYHYRVKINLTDKDALLKHFEQKEFF